MTLTIDRDGERLDSALSRLVPELTRSQAQRLIEQGAVTQAGRPVKKNEKLPAGTALLRLGQRPVARGDSGVKAGLPACRPPFGLPGKNPVAHEERRRLQRLTAAGPLPLYTGFPIKLTSAFNV